MTHNQAASINNKMKLKILEISMQADQEVMQGGRGGDLVNFVAREKHFKGTKHFVYNGRGGE